MPFWHSSGSPRCSAAAAAHAIVQNRSTPQTYSSLRMLADVAALRRMEADVVQGGVRYVEPALHATCEAVERLWASLSNAVFDGHSFDGTHEQTLLWHRLAGRLDFDYAERLRGAGLAHRLTVGSNATETLRYVADLLYPAESALDVLYGPAVRRAARVRRRLVRPLDLAIRAARRSLGSRNR